MKIVKVKTKGRTDIVDITERINQVILELGISEGAIHVFVLGSTASLTTIEADENLYRDLKEIFEELIPYSRFYHHQKTWGDDNGASHLRASLFGASLTLPVKNNKLFLGVWQRVVLVDFDTRPREREVVVFTS